MNSSTGSSTNSLLKYANDLDKSASKITLNAQHQIHELELIDMIDKKGIEDHKEKRELRSRLRSAEERIQTLEDILSKNSVNKSTKSKIVQTKQIPVDYANSLAARGLHGCSCSSDSSTTSSLLNSTTEESDLLLIQSSPISSRTATTSSLLNSKSTSKSTTKPVKVVVVDSKKPKHVKESKQQILIVDKSNKANAQEISRHKPKKHYTVDTISTDFTTATTSTMPTTKDASLSTSDIPTSTFTKSTTRPSAQTITVSDMSNEPVSESSDISTSTLLNSTKDSLKSREMKSDSELKCHRRHARYTEDEVERRAQERVREYLNRHQERKRAQHRDFLEGWHEHRVYQAREAAKPITTNEVINDLEKYAEVKFGEMQNICDSMQKKFCRCNRMRELECENKRLKMNMRRIKRAVSNYRNRKELKQIDDIFSNVNEQDLLNHIAVEFHDYLGANENISRETAYKLISRAAKAIKH